MGWSVLLSLMVAVVLVVLNQGWRRHAQERIHEQMQADATRERNRFLHRLDHELKNPLTAVQIGLVNLVEAPDLRERRTIQHAMQHQLNRVGRLVSDLRKLAQLESGQIEHLPVQIDHVLEEIIELLDLQEGQFQLLTDLATVPALVGDRDLMQLALYNVLDNAAKFSQPGEPITMHAEIEAGGLWLVIADRGVGIPDEDLPHVWEELYRSHNARGIPGSGIGLALVRAILERHNGTTEIQSTPGVGTTVRLWLPLAEG